jgi:hypothetical protein
LIETMYAPVKPVASFSPPSEGTGPSASTNTSSEIQESEITADSPND